MRPLRVIRTSCNLDVQAAASHRKLPPTLCVPEGRLRVDRRRMQIDDRQAATPVWHSPAFGRWLPFVNVFFRVRWNPCDFKSHRGARHRPGGLRYVSSKLAATCRFDSPSFVVVLKHHSTQENDDAIHHHSPSERRQ